jgi:hypothetical protein
MIVQTLTIMQALTYEHLVSPIAVVLIVRHTFVYTIIFKAGVQHYMQ